MTTNSWKCRVNFKQHSTCQNQTGSQEAQRPHVYGLCEGTDQEDLWRPERGQTNDKH